MISLRRRREKLGMTMTDLSNATGVSSNFISEIETGKHTCSFETLEKIVFALSDYEPTKRPRPVLGKVASPSTSSAKRYRKV